MFVAWIGKIVPVRSGMKSVLSNERSESRIDNNQVRLLQHR